MSGDQLVTSFSDISPRPPTPKETPTSAVFQSPIFETPKPSQSSCNESGGWTPRFAEEYSVFNSTPGNLRGSQGPYVDFGPGTPINGHKRLLSTDGFAVEIAAHVNHFSHPGLPLPPVDPSRRLASSPNSTTVPKEYTSESHPVPSPIKSKQFKSSKKARRGTASQSEPAQTATPPPTGHRGEHKLAPKLNMQNDQSFGQPDFTGGAQQHELAALMASSADMFGYPMSAPAGAPATFWDPSTMGMDLDFSMPAQTNVFQTTPAHGHRHTGSFDWNSEIQLFQHPSAPSVPVQHTNQETIQAVTQEQTLAPNPPVSQQTSMGGNPTLAIPFSTSMDDPFGIMAPSTAVDPGLLFSRPPSSAMNTNFLPITSSGSAEAAIAESGSRTPIGDELRRSASAKDIRSGNIPDRTFTNSPVKTNRPGLGRSASENRGRKPQNRPVLPKLAPAIKPAPQPSNPSNVEPARPLARPNGRTSPLKSQHRLSSLASIPESTFQPRTRTSVRFTIDSHGRARAETTIVPTEPDLDEPMPMRYRKTSRETTWRDGTDSLDDDSSSDDEPIIIPSRNNSFHASFALPDPLKPVGSIFHSSRRSFSDRSTSSFAHESTAGSQHDMESESEMIMNDRRDKVGDATSELRKVIEDRQKRSHQMGNARPHRFLQTNSLGNLRADTISPSTLTDSSMTERHDFRCVCNRKSFEDGDGFMVQCESCENWLHGKCINITRRTLPKVYICAFCANTPNMRGGRLRDTSRSGSMRGAGSGPSPLANKSFRSFR